MKPQEESNTLKEEFYPQNGVELCNDELEKAIGGIDKDRSIE